MHEVNRYAFLVRPIVEIRRFFGQTRRRRRGVGGWGCPRGVSVDVDLLSGRRSQSQLSLSPSRRVSQPRGGPRGPRVRRRRRAWRPRPAPPALWAVCRGATLGMRFRRRRRGVGGRARLRARRAAGTETADSAARGSRLRSRDAGQGYIACAHGARLAFACQPAQVAATQVSPCTQYYVIACLFRSITLHHVA